MPLARLHRPTARSLALLATRLRAGELVAVPTETVYGLAANAFDPRACAKIFAAKGRPSSDPLIVHIHSLNQLAELAEANDAALQLARKFWPGPLTLVLPKKPVVPDIVSSGLPSVAVRMPAHPLFRRLLRLAGVPLAAPSANPFGYVSPTTAKHVRAGLGRKIRHILDGGASRIGLESTIVDLRDPARPRLLRPGAITQAELERALGVKVTVKKSSAGSASRAQLAPGMLQRHYSPRTPVVLHKRISAATVRRGDAGAAWIFQRKPEKLSGENIFWFDPQGRPAGVARRLFATLRALDAKKFSRLHVELASESGLGTAINDRLRRAAAKA